MKELCTMLVTLFTTASFATIGYASEQKAIPAQPHYWMKFKAKDKQERTALANLGFSIETVVEDSAIAIGTAEDLALAKKTGKLEVFFELTDKTMDFPSYDSNFHNYTELKADLQSLADAHPNLLKLSSIGKSVEGRDLLLATISTDGNDLSRPAVFFMGGHHAREHVSIEMPLQLIHYLVAQYEARDLRIMNLLNNRTVYIVPIVNPDGAEYDISTGDYKLWRKNRRNNGPGESYGVDLNRNYGFQWGTGGSSKNTSSDVYMGPAPFSEPETQAIKGFFESHHNISIDLTFHTFSELILYPWGHKYDQIENQRDLLVHKTMAETMAKWNNYTPEQSSELYIASGDTTDWAYGQLGIISFTFELDPSSDIFNPSKGFYPGQDYIEPVFRKNLEPCLYLLEYADNPYRVTEGKSEAYGLNSPLLK